MSRQNKVNPGRYKVAGRLSPDDLGRELRRQNLASIAKEHGRQRQAPPFWQATDPTPPLEVAPSRAVAGALQESSAATARPRRKAKTTRSARTRTKARTRKAASPARQAAKRPKQTAKSKATSRAKPKAKSGAKSSAVRARGARRTAKPSRRR